MNAREFCYWLQGHFELGPTAEAIGIKPDVVAIIRGHLDLVAKVDPDHDNAFVEWLSVRLSPGATLHLGAGEVARMKRLLAAQFRHVIDPSYAGDKAELQELHDGNVHPQDGPYVKPLWSGGHVNSPGGMNMRC